MHSQGDNCVLVVFVVDICRCKLCGGCFGDSREDENNADGDYDEDNGEKKEMEGSTDKGTLQRR